MAASIRVTLFGGIIPRLSDRGLPDNAAQFALNAKLYSGELRAWNTLKELGTLSISNAKTVFHYFHGGSDRYLAFDVYTNVVKAPLVNETLGRLYWTNQNGAFINTTTRIVAAQPPYKLGVPAPTGTFTVVPTLGTNDTAESRVYLATVRTAWGEESAPGVPVSVNGNADGTWTVNGLNTLTIDTANYPNITHLSLWRTITSATGVDYRFVADWPVGARPASYVDNVSATTLSAAFALPSLGWDLPPPGLLGAISVAGGFLAGFVGRTVYLSVPYQPHAWPEDYQFAVDDDIVGLGTFGNTIVVCTKGRAFVLFGPAPEAMTLQKLEGVQPCLSARSIVSTTGGVMYASTDGLVIVDGSSGRGQIISRQWVTKDEWLANFAPTLQMSSVYQDRYFSFYSSQLGFTIGFDDPVTGFTELQQEGVQSVDLDSLTGQTLVTIGNKVYEWDGNANDALVYTWKSKPFLQNRPTNFGVIQLRGSFVGSGSDIPPPVAQGLGGYSLNSQRMGGGKSPSTLGGSLNGPPAWLALGLAPAPPATGPTVAVKVYCDGQLRWFGAIGDEEPHRLTSGYKGVLWEVEVQGESPLFSITLCETAKGLAALP